MIQCINGIIPRNQEKTLVIRTSLESMCNVAKNKGGRRIGAIRGRTQFMLPNGHYAKRDRQTGTILSVKADLKPYKNVIIERDPEITSITVDSPESGETAEVVTLFPFDRAA